MTTPTSPLTSAAMSPLPNQGSMTLAQVVTQSSVGGASSNSQRQGSKSVSNNHTLYKSHYLYNDIMFNYSIFSYLYNDICLIILFLVTYTMTYV